MRVEVPVMIQDPSIKGPTKVDTERIDDTTFSCFLDGPITDRVAVVDFDPVTGTVVPGARFELPDGGREMARYVVRDEAKFEAADFCQCNAFGTVAATIRMFEENDVLGRQVPWSFEAPQLLVVPRAGEWENAFYQRESSSLQFFFFPSRKRRKKTVYTCLSRDIVAHETGHAVFDGICPWLYDAISPQSLALHEAIADLTAVVMAFRSPKLREMVHRETGGSIEKSSAFSMLAEEFGAERHPEGLAYLRDLRNKDVLDESMVYADPHDLCNVLTGALYTVAIKLHNRLVRAEGEDPEAPSLGTFHKTIYLTQERLSRMLFRALDYLPPGEVSFADYGRAVFAADQASHVGQSQERKWLVAEFVKRGLADTAESLEVRTNFRVKGLDFDLEELISSDWVAYTFAEKQWRLLGFPKDAPFEVHPRLDVKKRYYIGGGQTKDVRECIFKVEWQHLEKNPKSLSLGSHRRVTVGTTLAIDWDQTQALREKGRNEMFVRAVLKLKPTEKTREQRDAFLQTMVDGGFLAFPGDGQGLDGRPARATVTADIADGFLRVRGTGRTLHMVR